MKKKVLVLGAVSCVAGIVTAAGCSSSETPAAGSPDATSTDARPERTPIESGPEEEAGTCYTPVTLAEDAKEWKPAQPSPGSCTSTELAKFEANYKDQAITTWKDIGTDLSPACAACLITPISAAKWGFVVYIDDTPEQGFQNWGACFSTFDGDVCGKSIQNSQTCSENACEKCPDKNASDACVEEATKAGGACEEYAGAVDTNCKQIQKSGAKCGTRTAAVKTLCGGIADGGTDSGDAADQ